MAFTEVLFFVVALLTIFTVISDAFLLSLIVFCVFTGASYFFFIYAGSISPSVRLIYLRLSFASSSRRRMASFGFD